jgi:hypothetical protein
MKSVKHEKRGIRYAQRRGFIKYISTITHTRTARSLQRTKLKFMTVHEYKMSKQKVINNFLLSASLASLVRSRNRVLNIYLIKSRNR